MFHDQGTSRTEAAVTIAIRPLGTLFVGQDEDSIFQGGPSLRPQDIDGIAVEAHQITSAAGATAVDARLLPVADGIITTGPSAEPHDAGAILAVLMFVARVTGGAGVALSPAIDITLAAVGNTVGAIWCCTFVVDTHTRCTVHRG